VSIILFSIICLYFNIISIKEVIIYTEIRKVLNIFSLKCKYILVQNIYKYTFIKFVIKFTLRNTHQ